MKTSESIKQLIPALIKVQASMKEAKRETLNTFYNSKYADLASVWECCRKPLTDNGFSVAQPTFFKDGHMFVETILLHASGEWISGEYLIATEKLGPQALGSSMTYSRRYSLAALVGVVTEDDDAQGATTTVRAAIRGTPAKTTPKDDSFAEAASDATSTVVGNDLLKFSFVPTVVTTKEDPNGKWISFGVKCPDGDWCNTKNENEGAILLDSKDSKKCVDIFYKIEGKWRNIKKVQLTEVASAVKGQTA